MNIAQYASPYTSVSHTFLLAGSFCLRKIPTRPLVLTDVNTVCPTDSYPKFKIYASELILDTY